ncbi:MAG: thiamine biosynthesis protein ThiS [Leptolyngbya sp. SIO4C1]|nr:thiamine biosynthesis protein ThiS [Leptolyngbya sp. SIO4C1]
MNASNPNPAASTVRLQVNGDPQTCQLQTTLPELLTQLGMNPRLVAVEYNGEILHRQFWQSTHLKTGDRLEIVTIVGGGSR